MPADITFLLAFVDFLIHRFVIYLKMSERRRKKVTTDEKKVTAIVSASFQSTEEEEGRRKENEEKEGRPMHVCRFSVVLDM